MLNNKAYRPASTIDDDMHILENTLIRPMQKEKCIKAK